MKKTKQSVPANPLLEAVQFISHVQRSKGNERATHCLVRYGFIVANDGLLAAGAPIAEHDLNCCPQTDRLRLALERCGSEHQIVQGDNSLFLRSGEFSAYIPLCDPAKLAVAVPDPALGQLGEAFRTALGVVGSLVRDSAPTLLQSCVQLDTGSCIATNGSVILQYWHGFDMPPGLLVPKQFIDALTRVKKSIVSFGFSTETLTIHFFDGSWLRTNLFRERIPNMVEKLSQSQMVKPLYPAFFEHAAVVAKFSEDERIYLVDGLIRSHNPKANAVGCYQSNPGVSIPDNTIFGIKDVALIAKHAKTFDDSFTYMTMFYGDNLRGAIAHTQLNAAPQPTPIEQWNARPKPSTMNCYECGEVWPYQDPYLCPKCGNDIPF